MKLLALDLSSSCTGWATFEVSKQKLLDCGAIKFGEKGISKLSYPERQLRKMLAIAEELNVLIEKENPDVIVIEEINPSKQRLGQKTLDGCHWILLLKLIDRIKTVRYRDSDGREGWRTQLGIKLSPSDRIKNKQVAEYNKKVKGGKKKEKINKKHIAVRWVNKKFNKNYDLDTDNTAGDVCDAIGLGWAELLNMSK